MKFEFKKMGVLDDAKLELADLTIICGENNTGKTYATYAIYGFLKKWRPLLREILSEDLFKEGFPKRFDLNEIFSKKLGLYVHKVSEAYSRQLHTVFSATEDFFNNSTLEVIEKYSLNFLDNPFMTKQMELPNGGYAVLQKEGGSNFLDLFIIDANTDVNNNYILKMFVVDFILDFIFFPLFPEAHISSAERTGAAIFRLNDVKGDDEYEMMMRNRMMRDLVLRSKKSPKNRDEIKFIERELSELNRVMYFYRLKQDAQNERYPLPVSDNVKFIQNLDVFHKRISEIALNNKEIVDKFNQMISGSYSFVDYQGIVYKQQNDSTKQFKMGNSSSSIRALLDVGFYLRCKAKPGDLFIIDEPELNLHPKNQRAFARLIARMVNAGIRVFITTHSDYIVKELNTLIMLAQKTQHTKKMQEVYGYEDEELLFPKQINLYMTAPSESSLGFYTLIPATIHPDLGIEVTTFDTSIDEMNKIQNDILDGDELC